jgi:phosphoglucosamine mutase
MQGLQHAGAHAFSVDVMTTPGIAFLTASEGFDSGIVISASHNPYSDNGIKIFLPSGKKLPESVESIIESQLGSAEFMGSPVIEGNSGHETLQHLESQYEEHILGLFSGLSLSGMRIAIDCANGACSAIAPRIFESLGAEVELIGASPDGMNINENCGSLHMDELRVRVRESNADLGVAFDGDADRALLCDASGELVDGDGILWIVAKEMLEAGNLEPRKVVSTVMSNVGLELAFRELGIELVRTDVGDKYVLDELLRNGGKIGGEQSGHVIFPDTSLVGDGIVTSLKVIEVLVRRGMGLSESLRGFKRYPQVLVNVRVSSKPPLESVRSVGDAIVAVSDALVGRGRILVRYSGTENLARVMIEGDDQSSIDRHAMTVSEAIREAIGSE